MNAGDPYMPEIDHTPAQTAAQSADALVNRHKSLRRADIDQLWLNLLGAVVTSYLSGKGELFDCKAVLFGMKDPITGVAAKTVETYYAGQMHRHDYEEDMEEMLDPTGFFFEEWYARQPVKLPRPNQNNVSGGKP
jgi:hypothetical protein